MSPRRLRRCSAWLLPFLAARMLVPDGLHAVAVRRRVSTSCSVHGLRVRWPAAGCRAEPGTRLTRGMRPHGARDTTATVRCAGSRAAFRPPEPRQCDLPIRRWPAGAGAAPGRARSLAEPPRIVSLLPGPSADPSVDCARRPDRPHPRSAPRLTHPRQEPIERLPAASTAAAAGARSSVAAGRCASLRDTRA